MPITTDEAERSFTNSTAERQVITLLLKHNLKVFRKGYPDFIFPYDGRLYGIEVKRFPDPIKEDQEHLIKLFNELGHPTFVATPEDHEDVVKLIVSKKATPKMGLISLKKYQKRISDLFLAKQQIKEREQKQIEEGMRAADEEDRLLKLEVINLEKELFYSKRRKNGRCEWETWKRPMYRLIKRRAKKLVAKSGKKYKNKFIAQKMEERRMIYDEKHKEERLRAAVDTLC